MSFKPMKDRSYGSTSDVVSRLFEQSGGVPEVMKILAMSRTRVYALADPNDKAQISYERVATLTEQTGAAAAAEHLAGLAHGVFLPIDLEEDADWYRLASRVAKESADLLSHLLDSISPDDDTPGEIDAKEARELMERVDRQLRLLAVKRRALLEIIADSKG